MDFDFQRFYGPFHAGAFPIGSEIPDQGEVLWSYQSAARGLIYVVGGWRALPIEIEANKVEKDTPMDKEQQKRMAYRTIVLIQEDEDIEFTVQVSGDQVELHRTYDQPWDNEHGTGQDVSHEIWKMNKDTLKVFLDAAQWCINKSEAFEASHPEASHDDEVRDELARQLRNERGTDEQ